MVADADRLDGVYRVLARHLPMTSTQRRNVLGRDREIPLSIRRRMAALVGPVPSDASVWRPVHREIVRNLKEAASDEFLARVPELAARDGGSYAVLHTRRRALYFEPWKDEEGRIVALRAYMGRRADEQVPHDHGALGAPGALRVRTAPARDVDRVPWILTEGWMKAEVAAHHLGCRRRGLRRARATSLLAPGPGGEAATRTATHRSSSPSTQRSGSPDWTSPGRPSTSHCSSST